ncbi:MAG: hypothetical protein M5U28_28285 [Sandaracinaceae bacterium]|nr:hypothetical protein [Sandaracinaceae bacterium]
MQMRFAVLEGHRRTDTPLDRAERDVRTAASVAEHPIAPTWVRGWVPRYEADFAYFATRNPEDASLREALASAWNANLGFGFQQVLLLARFAAWSIDPADLLNEIAVERVRDTLRRGTSHSGEPHGGVRDLREHARPLATHPLRPQARRRTGLAGSARPRCLEMT